MARAIAHPGLPVAAAVFSELKSDVLKPLGDRPSGLLIPGDRPRAGAHVAFSGTGLRSPSSEPPQAFSKGLAWERCYGC